MLIHIWRAGDIAPLLVLVLLASNAVAAEEHNPATSSPDLPYSDGDLHADTWVATDALGRIQPGIAETGPPRKDKFAGIFYWTWRRNVAARQFSYDPDMYPRTTSRRTTK